jgi:hypothetical protein
MKRFDTSAEVFAAGYALPYYWIDSDVRSWRYRDNIFVTPIDVPVERVNLADRVLAVLHMESYKNERT